MPSALSAQVLAYGHGHGSGVAHLLSTIAHAAIWSTVGRLIWHAPVLLVLVAAGSAGVYLLCRGGRR